MSMVTTSQKFNGLMKLIEDRKGAIAQALPKHLTPERMIRIVNTAIQRTPALLECTERSIVNSVVIASQLGLEPDGRMGALVPYRNKFTKQKEAQFQPMFQGLCDLARRTGQVLDIYTVPVYSCDEFKVTQGTDRKIEHDPKYNDPRYGKQDELIGVYAVAMLRDNPVPHFEYMPKAEIEHVRNRSKASSADSPWNTDYVEMCRKTATKRLCKMIPSSPELQRAIDVSNAGEESKSQGAAAFIDVPFEEPNDNPDIEPTGEESNDSNGAAPNPDRKRESLLKIIDAMLDKMPAQEVRDDAIRPIRISVGRRPGDEYQKWSTEDLVILADALAKKESGE